MTDKASPVYVESLPKPGEPSFMEWLADTYPERWAYYRAQYKISLAIVRNTHQDPNHICDTCPEQDKL